MNIPIFVAAALVAALPVLAAEPASRPPGLDAPFDPAAPSTPLPAPGLPGAYRALPALEALPWRQLFDAAGNFVPPQRA